MNPTIKVMIEMESYAGMILSVLSLVFSAETKGEKERSEQGCGVGLLIPIHIRVHNKASSISVWLWSVTFKRKGCFVICIK